jgi:hypothetical protein
MAKVRNLHLKDLTPHVLAEQIPWEKLQGAIVMGIGQDDEIRVWLTSMGYPIRALDAREGDER